MREPDYALTIPIPLGALVVYRDTSSTYQGVFIDLRTPDGTREAIAHVEWDPHHHRVHVRCWRAGEEDPVAHLDWTTGHVLD